jgi:hypothetical protein
MDIERRREIRSDVARVLLALAVLALVAALDAPRPQVADAAQVAAALH